jgi:hypothetical protein
VAPPPYRLDGVPNLPEQYQRRPDLEEKHRNTLLRTGTMTITAATTGVSGPAGAGKSTMAICLARDLDVQAHFSDGITWLPFGRERTGADVLYTLAPRLGVDGIRRGVAGEIFDFRLSPAGYAEAISRKLAGQRRLLVLDDVWTTEQLGIFQALTAEGGLLGLLVTTRNDELAAAHGPATKVDALSDEEGLRVLAVYAGVTVEELIKDPREPYASGRQVRTHGLVKRPDLNDQLGTIVDSSTVGGRLAVRLPHLTNAVKIKLENLTLVREENAQWLVSKCSGNPAMLRAVAALCKKKSVAAARGYLEQCLQELCNARVPEDGKYAQVVDGQFPVYRTLFDALGGILNHLDPPELKKRCMMLAVFPEDTDVPLAVVGKLWGTSEVETDDAVTELAAWHLIDVTWEWLTAQSPPSLSLIDLHLDYLRASAKDDLAVWHRALLRRCGRQVLGNFECGKGGATKNSERTEDDAYWSQHKDGRKNLAHHLAGGGPRSLDGLSALKTLDLSDYKGLKSLPSLDGLTSLQTLLLSDCSSLTSLPSFEGLMSLRELKLSGCTGLRDSEGSALPPSLGGLTALEWLDMDGCSGLTSLPSIDGLAELRALSLRDCSGLKSLPSLNGLTALQELDLNGCSGLTSLPSLDKSTALEELDLGGCSGLTSLPSFHGLSALKTLKIDGSFASDSKIGELRERGVDVRRPPSTRPTRYTLATQAQERDVFNHVVDDTTCSAGGRRGARPNL